MRAAIPESAAISSLLYTTRLKKTQTTAMVGSDCSFDLYRMELFKRFGFLNMASTPTEIQPSPIRQKKIHS